MRTRASARRRNASPLAGVGVLVVYCVPAYYILVHTTTCVLVRTTTRVLFVGQIQCSILYTSSSGLDSILHTSSPYEWHTVRKRMSGLVNCILMQVEMCTAAVHFPQQQQLPIL